MRAFKKSGWKVIFLFFILFCHPGSLKGHPGSGLSDGDKEQLLKYVRLVFDGKTVEASELKFSSNVKNLKQEAILFAFDAHGKLLAKVRTSKGATSSSRVKNGDSVNYLATLSHELHSESNKARLVMGQGEFIDSIRRKKSPYKPKPEYLHVQLVTKSKHHDTFKKISYTPFAMGLDCKYKDKEVELSTVEALIFNLTKKRVPVYVARHLEIDPGKIFDTEGISCEVYEVIHFGERFPGGEFTDYKWGHEVVLPEEVTGDEIQKRLRLAEEWFKKNKSNRKTACGDTTKVKRHLNKPKTLIQKKVAALIARQYTPANMYYVAGRARKMGAFKRSLFDNEISLRGMCEALGFLEGVVQKRWLP